MTVLLFPFQFGFPFVFFISLIVIAMISKTILKKKLKVKIILYPFLQSTYYEHWPYLLFSLPLPSFSYIIIARISNKLDTLQPSSQYADFPEELNPDKIVSSFLNQYSDLSQ